MPLDFDHLELGFAGAAVAAVPGLRHIGPARPGGNPFVGQQAAPALLASVLVTDLHWFGDTNPAQALADSAFLWLTIDGVAQALSDVGGLGLAFGTHPLYPSIPVLLIDNEATTIFGFDTFGASALEAARADPPDVMLVDIGLPGMDGYELARRVRQDAALRDVLLIALTGYGREEDRRRALAAGFHHHLVKPVDPDALQGLVAGRSAADGPTVH